MEKRKKSRFKIIFRNEVKGKSCGQIYLVPVYTFVKQKGIFNTRFISWFGFEIGLTIKHKQQTLK